MNDSSKHASPKTALVTGATRGIGYETVRQLARAGVHTLLAGRDRTKATEAALNLQIDGLPVEAIQLDVTDAASVAEAARQVRERHGGLDILVNNAGILLEKAGDKPSASSPDTWRQTFDTNLFGVVAVTQAFLPLLKLSPAGRIVNVSSILGSNTLHSDPSSSIYDFKVAAYGASKSALNAWTVHLAHELRDSGIKVKTVHPGYVKTDINGGDGAIEVVEGASSSVAMALIGAGGPSGSFTHKGETLPW